MKHCFKSLVSHHFRRSYLKANKVNKSEATRKVEYAYNFSKFSPCLSKLQLAKLARFFRYSVFTNPKLTYLKKPITCKKTSNPLLSLKVWYSQHM